MEKRGKSNSFFLLRHRVFTLEALPFRVVVRELKGAGQQMVHVHGLTDLLACGRGKSLTQKISATKLFRRQAHSMGNAVHMAFHRKQTLRGAKAAKRSMWRTIRCKGL